MLSLVFVPEKIDPTPAGISNDLGEQHRRILEAKFEPDEPDCSICDECKDTIRPGRYYCRRCLIKIITGGNV
jgi:hypothetical protein